MRPIRQKSTSIAPVRSNGSRVAFTGANVILAVALTPFIACIQPAYGQTSQVSPVQVAPVASSQAPEQCNYTDQESRPGTSSASAEAAAAADSYTSTGSPAEGFRLPELKADKASAAQQNVECKPDEEKNASSAQAQKATPEAVPAPAQPVPAQPVPLVAYSNGLLTITAHDARFVDVLNAIRARTGVAVDFPATMPNDRVFDEIGPAPMREVLMAFLDGSRFNYVMLGSSSDSRIVHRLILTPRYSASIVPDANHPAVPVQREADAYAAPSADDEQQEPQPQPVPAARVVQPLPSSVGKTLQDEAAALQQANPQMTHGEILAEMQRRNTERLDQEAAQSESQAPQPPPQ